MIDKILLAFCAQLELEIGIIKVVTVILADIRAGIGIERLRVVVRSGTSGAGTSLHPCIPAAGTRRKELEVSLLGRRV